MTNIAKAHGLDGTLVYPDWIPLAMDEIRSLLKNLPQCGEFINILSISPRPFSAAGMVATSRGRFFIKRHHCSVRNREGLLEEHGFMAHLRNGGVPVPRVQVSAEGQTAIELGDWTYEIHEQSPGIDLYQDAISWTPFRSADHAYSAGRALAGLHSAAQGFPAAERKIRPLVASFSIFASTRPEEATRDYLQARPALADDAATQEDCGRALKLLAPFHAELLPLLPGLHPLWTHNDLHASNLFWSAKGDRAQVTSIIDVGLADRTNAVHDLAHAIERNIVEWLMLVQDKARDGDIPVHLDHLTALLKGYESVRTLSAAEAAALAPMTALCHAEFALTEADYFLGALHSATRARVATRDYLVGHARWFHTRTGEMLLSAIRNWAAARVQQQPAGAQR
ncbi:MAG TPA: phosphotransferase [Terracidiphilus sp.]|nr:phosphotransferase [Terracidiphilus sp.]